METPDGLRWLSLIAWSLVAVYMVPGAWSAAVKTNVRRGDPMRLACFATAVIMGGFSARWLFAPDSNALWHALYILSIADAVFIWRLARAYGRGGYVG